MESVGNIEYDEELGALKGMIDYPCGCKTRVLIYENAKGDFSVRCPVCGKFCRFNSEMMSGRVVRPVRGAVKKLNLPKPPSR